ncbi:MAG TPA: alpha/beta hydrolase [Stellaceae bacterium]|nr:alpha/beta hydrolase [Stellaceae bacterium]
MDRTLLDPDCQRVLDLIREAGRPPYETLSPAEARETYRAGRRVLQPDPPEVAEVRNLKAPGPQGEIPLRLYRGIGTERGAALPALVYFHGGGWVIGDLDTHDGVCRLIANASGCAVVSVDYRLAPEHTFPVAVDDAVAATEWVAANANSFGIDAGRLAVGGDSAGGNLAAVVALVARDRGGPRLRFQMLIYPATDFVTSDDPGRERFDGFPLNVVTMNWFRDHYLRNAADYGDWRASPLRAKDLHGLPPTYVLTAGFDPLHAEGDAYAKRLREAGVPVQHRHMEEQMHGFLTMGKIIAAARSATEEAALALKSALS